jgi:hypothetical protein
MSPTIVWGCTLCNRCPTHRASSHLQSALSLQLQVQFYSPYKARLHQNYSLFTFITVIRYTSRNVLRVRVLRLRSSRACTPDSPPLTALVLLCCSFACSYVCSALLWPWRQPSSPHPHPHRTRSLIFVFAMDYSLRVFLHLTMFAYVFG